MYNKALTEVDRSLEDKPLKHEIINPDLTDRIIVEPNPCSLIKKFDINTIFWGFNG